MKTPALAKLALCALALAAGGSLTSCVVAPVPPGPRVVAPARVVVPGPVVAVRPVVRPWVRPVVRPVGPVFRPVAFRRRW